MILLYLNNIINIFFLNIYKTGNKITQKIQQIYILKYKSINIMNKLIPSSLCTSPRSGISFWNKKQFISCLDIEDSSTAVRSPQSIDIKDSCNGVSERCGEKAKESSRGCERCQQYQAVLQCMQCDHNYFCQQCFKKVHESPKFKLHSPIKVNSQPSIKLPNKRKVYSKQCLTPINKLQQRNKDSKNCIFHKENTLKIQSQNQFQNQNQIQGLENSQIDFQIRAQLYLSNLRQNLFRVNSKWGTMENMVRKQIGFIKQSIEQWQNAICKEIQQKKELEIRLFMKSETLQQIEKRVKLMQSNYFSTNSKNHLFSQILQTAQKFNISKCQSSEQALNSINQSLQQLSKQFSIFFQKNFLILSKNIQKFEPILSNPQQICSQLKSLQLNTKFQPKVKPFYLYNPHPHSNPTSNGNLNCTMKPKNCRKDRQNSNNCSFLNTSSVNAGFTGSGKKKEIKKVKSETILPFQIGETYFVKYKDVKKKGDATTRGK